MELSPRNLSLVFHFLDSFNFLPGGVKLSLLPPAAQQQQQQCLIREQLQCSLNDDIKRNCFLPTEIVIPAANGTD